MIWCEESWRDALDRVCENRVFYGMIVDYRITCNNGNQRTLINP